ncbi:SRPBCC family protein [Nocardioides sp. cx-173]|uniref:SRPBCC family protein n=1 Tax=Nocardioides sp. cx-173 TaxID=2898796 RepID=UPI001E3E2A7D|nr:SRPBCC family protein [Nocardioides sp. cx-173]MCD4524249.1 SRPBCC family protein [Nocardioides sp. cx-173]UGB41641.1 SRPBCC family protein [Nocardioides sp. cx-173]
MAGITHSERLSVPPSAAWGFVERYTRSEVHIFSSCVGERQDGEYRIVTLADGSEVAERNVTVDPERMRAVYTVPGLLGAEHHHAEMRILEDTDGGATLTWTIDVLPHELADRLGDTYAVLFGELVEAVNARATVDRP